MSCIVVNERGKIGSYYYRTKSERETKHLFCALSLIEHDGLQIVSVSDISDYKEYEPSVEVEALAELFVLIGQKAMKG